MRPPRGREVVLLLIAPSLGHGAAVTHVGREARRARASFVLEGPRRGALVHSVAFSPDGQWLASGDDQGGVDLWSLDDRRLAATRSRPPAPDVRPTDVAFLPDGRLVAAVAFEPTVVLDVPALTRHHALGASTTGISFRGLATSGRRVAQTVLSGRSVEVWDGSTIASGRDELWTSIGPAFAVGSRTGQVMSVGEPTLMYVSEWGARNLTVLAWVSPGGDALPEGTIFDALALTPDEHSLVIGTSKPLAAGGGEGETPIPGSRGVRLWDLVRRGAAGGRRPALRAGLAATPRHRRLTPGRS